MMYYSCDVDNIVQKTLTFNETLLAPYPKC